MTRLVWGNEQPQYETGIDRGVLYPLDSPGVVWNGLISVDQAFVGGETSPYYFDGIKYVETVSPKNYQATLSAYTAPEEFSPCIGDKSVVPGFVLTKQIREQFGLSYRTLNGDVGYKIHLLYNALASPSNTTHSTLSATVDPSVRSWTIDAVPIYDPTRRPSAHFVVDSTEVDPVVLNLIESTLYGTAEEAPRLPSVDELIDALAFWDPVIIVPDFVSGFSELISGTGDLYRSRVDGILRLLPESRLYESTTEGFYRME